MRSRPFRPKTSFCSRRSRAGVARLIGERARRGMLPVLLSGFGVTNSNKSGWVNC